MKILIILAGLVATLWALNKWLKPEMREEIDSVLRRGVPLMKKALSKISEAIAIADKALDKYDANAEATHQSIDKIQQTQIEPLSIKASPIETVNNHDADTGVKTNDQVPEVSVLNKQFESSSVTLVAQSNDFSEARTEKANITKLPVEKQRIPEEATLKRHFMTQLMAEIESELFPRPTDSILKRHYDSLISEKLADRLAEMS